MPKLVSNNGDTKSVKKAHPTQRLHNRTTGLTVRPKAVTTQGVRVHFDRAKKDNIAKGLQSLAVDIGSLKPDPLNARLHPERNIEAIKESLATYGQMSPIVVRKQGRIVMKGNGTLEAAKQLGWTKLAAVFVEMDEATAAGFGLADNRTAELAKWNFEVVAVIDKLLQENDHPSIGWSDDELMVLRAADWTPPPLGEDEDGDGKPKPLLVSFTPDQRDMIDRCIAAVREARGEPDLDEGVCIAAACEDWLEARREES